MAFPVLFCMPSTLFLAPISAKSPPHTYFTYITCSVFFYSLKLVSLLFPCLGFPPNFSFKTHLDHHILQEAFATPSISELGRFLSGSHNNLHLDLENPWNLLWSLIFLHLSLSIFKISIWAETVFSWLNVFYIHAKTNTIRRRPGARHTEWKCPYVSLCT